MKSIWRIYLIENSNTLVFVDTDYMSGMPSLDKTGNRFNTKEEALEAMPEVMSKFGNFGIEYTIIETFQK